MKVNGSPGAQRAQWRGQGGAWVGWAAPGLTASAPLFPPTCPALTDFYSLETAWSIGDVEHNEPEPLHFFYKLEIGKTTKKLLMNSRCFAVRLHIFSIKKNYKVIYIFVSHVVSD